MWFLAGIKAVKLIVMCTYALKGKTTRAGQKSSCVEAVQVPLGFTDKKKFSVSGETDYKEKADVS